ncbi:MULTISPECIES: GTP 3',8-cyclase MoaA [unclassified Pseudofrankia]|uniref:GTP 3',8-cyclase MoaA n=1 Tax=unclassified Pseudofrankia TaxID=2994372 RepID=UPI000A8DB4CF|nr:MULTISPECIES: GTP 3',8-cyclase MoaA [unclassified Pseudofrankia]MDT3439226.1 GTP 3',8-cyclase MoaA [Pseudofrankia sp. BMG5.37]
MIPLTLDRRGRPLRDLRISVTDRCNFRCRYCMPREHFGHEHRYLERADLLTFEEITRLARLFVSLGVRKLRLTGGEPLLRRGVEDLVRLLAAIPGVDLTMTTNGVLLPSKAALLAAAGLRRVTVSLDALDDEVFGALTDTAVPVRLVLDGIDAAARAGLAPIKVNMVVKRGVNDQSMLPMVEFFRGSGHILRFIEFMDVGATNEWKLDEVVPAAEIVSLIDRRHPLEPLPPDHPGEVATRYRFRDGAGEIGVIASVTRPFCEGCTRARLSADGKIHTCLFASTGTDLRALLRTGAGDEELLSAIRGLWTVREDRYSELRGRQASSRGGRVEMSYIGG